MAALATAPTTVCQTDTVERFFMATPNIQRFGGTGRVTARLGDNHEGFFMVNFQQSTVDYTGFPPLIRGQANAGILFRPFSTASGPAANLAPGSAELRLPVYVCPTGVGSANGLNTGCTATTPGATLNPNNPFAANNQLARILGRPFTEPTYNETRSRVYRLAMGVNGTVADWDYRVDFTAMHNDLRRTQNNYIFIGNLLTAIAQGTVNLVNPEQNSQQTMDFIMPDNISHASSDLVALQASVAKSLFELPGGPLQIGFGAQVRYEAVDAPSGNPDTNGPTQRYFTLNAFGTVGDRTVYSAFGEINAPVLDMLEINASGRYDSYSADRTPSRRRSARSSRRSTRSRCVRPTRGASVFRPSARRTPCRRPATCRPARVTSPTPSWLSTAVRWTLTTTARPTSRTTATVRRRSRRRTSSRRSRAASPSVRSSTRSATSPSRSIISTSRRRARSPSRRTLRPCWLIIRASRSPRATT
jgi:hypothetical protein